MTRRVEPPNAQLACPVPPPGFSPAAGVERILARSRCVWLEAPAGFGKTCHAAWFVRARHDRSGVPFVWCTLEDADADPRTLARHLAAALAVTGPGLVLPVPARPGASVAAWTGVGRHLAGLLVPLGALVLVVDEVERLAQGPRIGAPALLAGLIEAAPPAIRIVLAGQRPPAGLPVDRWFGDGRVARIGADDLRLDRTGVLRILRGRVPEADGALAAQVLEATGGWPLVVRLAAEHLSGREGDAVDVATLLARGEALSRYLAVEILDRLDPAAACGLLALSLADEVDPFVAEALCGETKVPWRTLVRPPWFAALAADGNLWRLHPLLRAFLRGEAAMRLDPAVLRHLHGRLAVCLAQRRAFARALEHALEAADSGLALSLLDRAALDQLALGQAARVEGWLAALPDGVVAAPVVLLVRARLAAVAGEHGRAARLAWAAAAAWLRAGDPGGAVAAVALCALDLDLACSAEVGAAIDAAASSGDAGLSAWADLWRLKVMAAANGASVAPQAVDRALAALEEALPLDPHTSRAAILADHLRYLAGSVGSIRASASRIVEALAWQMFDYWPALVYAGRWDELALLLDEAQAVRVPAASRDFVRTWLGLPRALLAALDGRPAEAVKAVEAIERALVPAAAVAPSWPLEMTVLRAVRAGCLLRAGRGAQAESLSRANRAALSMSPVMAPVAHLDLGAVLLAGGRLAEAATELARADALGAEGGLRGLYYRTLTLALQLLRAEASPQAVTDLLAEIETKGAYGLWPLYDPGPIRSALADLAEEGLSPPLRAARRHIAALYARADRAWARAAPEAAPRLVTLGRLGWRDGAIEPPLPSRRVCELLVRLLWAQGRAVPRESLAEAIWPGAAPDEQGNRLRVTLYALKRWQESAATAGSCAGLAVADRVSVRLEAWQALGFDVALFRAAMARARDLRDSAPGEGFGQAVRAALDLYPGPFLPEPVWYEAFLSERRELEREHAAFADWAVRAVGLADRDAPLLLQRAVRANPADETLARLWLEALVCQGRMAEARRALDVCAALLDQEVGIEPPDEWLRLVRG